MQKSDPVREQIIIEQRKEIARLQKLLARTEVKRDSEIARLKAQLAEARKKSHVMVTRILVDPNDERL